MRRQPKTTTVTAERTLLEAAGVWDRGCEEGRREVLEDVNAILNKPETDIKKLTRIMLYVERELGRLPEEGL